MSRAKYFYATAYLLILMGLAGCKSTVSVTAQADAASGISIELTQGPAVVALLSSLTANAPEQDIFSAEAVEAALKGGPLQNARAAVPRKYSLTLSGTVSADQPLIRREGNTLSIHLSPDALCAIKDSLPPETQAGLDMLMAPVFTKESMSIEEYTGLLAAVYGQDVADEVSGSTVQVRLKPPAGRRIASASQVQATSASEATVSLPLLDLLTLSEARRFSISW